MAVDCSVLDPFARPDHFVAYPFETHGSHAVTARAIQALALAGRDVTPWRRSIEESQQPDGWWTSEKWNRSRLYGTSLAVAALDADSPAIKAAHECVSHATNTQMAAGAALASLRLWRRHLRVLALCSIAQRTDVELECIEAISRCTQLSAAHVQLAPDWQRSAVDLQRSIQRKAGGSRSCTMCAACLGYTGRAVRLSHQQHL